MNMPAQTNSNQPSKPTQLENIVRTGYPSVYVEGLTQMLVGFPNSRLLLHSLAERNTAVPDAPEVRQLACELIMPTSILIELAHNILNSLGSNKALLENAKHESMEKYEALLNSLPTIQTVVPVKK